jgi:hypothetical protein
LLVVYFDYLETKNNLLGLFHATVRFTDIVPQDPQNQIRLLKILEREQLKVKREREKKEYFVKFFFVFFLFGSYFVFDYL